jgi:hypothetical protein
VEWVARRMWGVGDMTHTLYAHMNNKTIKNEKKDLILELILAN